MSLAPFLAAKLGRGDQVRAGGVEGRGATKPTGQGRVYGRGATAAGLAAEANLGSIGANFKADTGTISVLMLAGIVVGVALFYGWTRGSQA